MAPRMAAPTSKQGYIRTRESLFHVPGLFRHSQPGQLFDPNGGGADDTLENMYGLGPYDGLSVELENG